MYSVRVPVKKKIVPANSSTETCHSNVLIGPKMNVTNPLINNLPMNTDTESLIHVLNVQPWLVENSAASRLTYNLPLPVITASPLL